MCRRNAVVAILVLALLLLTIVAAAVYFAAGSASVATVTDIRAPRWLPREIRVATWNIENFGWTKVNDPPRVRAIAEIVRSYDIVAVQEISDAHGRVPAQFLETLNAAGDSRWNVLASVRTGSEPDDHSSAEQYGFFYDEATIEIVDSGAVFPDAAFDRFQREPFAARFRARATGLTFGLVTVHTSPTAAVAEIGALDEVFAWARSRWPDEPHILVLGDFNAGCHYASTEHLDALLIRGPRYRWIVPDDADTNVAAAACAYDRIVTTAETASLVVDWGVAADAFDPAALDLSDHWPVWVRVGSPP